MWNNSGRSDGSLDVRLVLTKPLHRELVDVNDLSPILGQDSYMSRRCRERPDTYVHQDARSLLRHWIERRARPLAVGAVGRHQLRPARRRQRDRGVRQGTDPCTRNVQSTGSSPVIAGPELIRFRRSPNVSLNDNAPSIDVDAVADARGRRDLRGHRHRQLRRPAVRRKHRALFVPPDFMTAESVNKRRFDLSPWSAPTASSRSRRRPGRTAR